MPNRRQIKNENRIRLRRGEGGREVDGWAFMVARGWGRSSQPRLLREWLDAYGAGLPCLDREPCLGVTEFPQKGCIIDRCNA